MTEPVADLLARGLVRAFSRDGSRPTIVDGYAALGARYGYETVVQMEGPRECVVYAPGWVVALRGIADIGRFGGTLDTDAVVARRDAFYARLSEDVRAELASVWALGGDAAVRHFLVARGLYP